jgi:hypothetical protein
MCRRPCFGTPEDIQKIIEAGFGDRLMVEWWAEAEGIPYTELLCGAIKGEEGKEAPFWPIREEGCTFWIDGLCELHDKGLKPIEGRLAHHDENGDQMWEAHKEIIRSWDTDRGKAMVEKFRKEHL